MTTIHDLDCLCGLGEWLAQSPWYELRRVVVPLGRLDPNNWIVRKMIERGDIEPVCEA